MFPLSKRWWKLSLLIFCETDFLHNKQRVECIFVALFSHLQIRFALWDKSCWIFRNLFLWEILLLLQIINIYVLMDISSPRDIDMHWSRNGAMGTRLGEELWMREFRILPFLPPIHRSSLRLPFCVFFAFMNNTSAQSIVCECKNLFIRFISGRNGETIFNTLSLFIFQVQKQLCVAFLIHIITLPTIIVLSVDEINKSRCEILTTVFLVP